MQDALPARLHLTQSDMAVLEAAKEAVVVGSEGGEDGVGMDDFAPEGAGGGDNGDDAVAGADDGATESEDGAA